MLVLDVAVGCGLGVAVALTSVGVEAAPTQATAHRDMSTIPIKLALLPTMNITHYISARITSLRNISQMVCRIVIGYWSLVTLRGFTQTP